MLVNSRTDTTVKLVNYDLCSRPPVGFESDAELPGDAEFSGYVKNGVEFWISQKQLDLAVYMVDGSLVGKWPRANPMFDYA